MTFEAGATIKILFLGANPSNTTQLALGREVREITQRLRASADRDRFDFAQEWAVRADDLQAALMRHRPQIVHFSGHGERLAAGAAPPSPTTRGGLIDPPQAPAATTSGLVLEDASGHHVTIEARPLARLFALVGKQVRCVVLNACYSALQAEAIGEHVDSVVGMTTAIQDEAAIAFAGAFYEALGFGESIETAFELGKVAIDLRGLDDADIPRLRSRQVAPAAAAPTPPPVGAPTRPAVRQLLGLVLRGDADLDAFCLDHFEDVHRRFSGGMDRVAKVTLLLQQREPAEIARALREADPEGFARHAHVLAPR